MARWFRRKSTPQVSTPPSVTSASAKTASRTRRPSRRSRRSGWAPVCRAVPSSWPAARAVPGSVARAHPPTASATTAMAGQTQRHETPAWMTSAAAAAPVSAPALNSAWRRTRDDGLVTRRCDASAFMAVSMEPPAISTSTSTVAKAHRCVVSASTQSRTAQAKSAIHRSRRAPTRSARCAMTALEAPATAMATASSRPSWASLSENACWTSKSITAQLPQKRPNVAKAATTGPAPARSRGPSTAGGVALRVCPNPPWPGRRNGRPRPGSPAPRRRGRRRRPRAGRRTR